MKKAYLLLYHGIWFGAVLCSLPLRPFCGKSRWFRRLFPRLPQDPIPGKTVWVHALSVGEVISAIPLIRALRERCPRREIVLTVTTRQGLEIARRELGGELRALLPMPLDFLGAVRRLAHHLNPAIFILVETDLWPGLLFHLRDAGVGTLLVNGRISPRT
ncbi:MAG: hypothetical protein JW821_08560, partial [Deltaproteobacteria bacterium]|nr:hypothetical protein [Deltaproteobacteria bacterium]